MPRTSRSPEMLSLQRQQLDSRLRDLPAVPEPADGWVRTIRNALAMTAAQLGKRMDLSPQGVLDTERRERDGSITIGKLRSAAAALGCELRVVFVPRPSLEETVNRQAESKARAERNRLVHTMRLEAQEEGVEQVLDEDKAREAWLTMRLAQLWD